MAARALRRRASGASEVIGDTHVFHEPFGTGEWEPFDIGKDPGRIYELSDAYAEVKAEMIAAWQNYARTNDVYDHKGLTTTKQSILKTCLGLRVCHGPDKRVGISSCFLKLAVSVFMACRRGRSSNKLRGAQPFHILVTLCGVIALAGCASLPRNPVPLEQVQSAQVPDMPLVRA